MSRKLFLATALAIGAVALGAAPAQAQTTADKPNILVIWGDDIGWYNISAYNLGVMGYKTPNIDRIAREGALFTDWYGQQSCTAGRAAFLTGQSPIRTGLTKVGLPGADLGLQKEDVTLAEMLKPLGYTTGQFGKNHLGDLDEHLPTNHGFDEFFGNLYHLNAEEEPENPDYFKDPDLKKRFGPRGVIHSYADGRIEDTGPLTRKRMETMDEEVTSRAIGFMQDAHKQGKPFFVWWNSTRMHIWTHLKAESQGKTGLGIYPDGMVEHDAMVGQLLKALDDMGIANNTNWEGGYRVPMAMKWPGVIKPGAVYNNVGAHEDMIPTLMAALGDPNIADELTKGKTIGGTTYKVHLDGYNWLPYLKGEAQQGPRREFLYWTDDGDLAALRYDQWKLVFMEQRAHGYEVWQDPMVVLRFPKLFSLRADPFERADHEGIDYAKWRLERAFLLVPAQAFVGQWLASFAEFPPRQKPASFGIDQVMEKIQNQAAGVGK